VRLIVAGLLLAAATALGLLIVATPKLARFWQPGAIHGTFGVVGFLLLALSLGGPRRGVAMGAGSFGLDAALLFGAAILTATLLIAARLRRRPAPLLAIGLHATFAVAGITVLGVYLSFP